VACVGADYLVGSDNDVDAEVVSGFRELRVEDPSVSRKPGEPSAF
jgi:hypothetical protein